MSSTKSHGDPSDDRHRTIHEVAEVTLDAATLTFTANGLCLGCGMFHLTALLLAHHFAAHGLTDLSLNDYGAKETKEKVLKSLLQQANNLLPEVILESRDKNEKLN